MPPVTITGVWPPAGAPAPRGDRPILIARFTGDRNLNIDNWTVNGPGAPPGDSTDNSENGGTNASGGKGKDGLRLNIWNNGGPINIVNNVVLNLADGGAGGDATAVCATATGGVGGNSGNFRMTAAAGIDITAGTLTINPGRGGNGGNALVDEGAPGTAGCPGEAGRSGTATGGKGGDNQKRLFARGNVAGLENVTIGPVFGGDGGIADVTSCDGGPGDPCCDGGKGGNATATGGAGGNASLSVGDLPVTVGAANGGDGGEASAFAGTGGDGGDCKLDDGGNGGDGGDATATAGAGGSATNNAGAANGGAGGDATAFGGNGGDGGDSGLGTPGAGGAGGAGTAVAGAGGAAAAAGLAGEPFENDGLPGLGGGEIENVVLYCFDFGFLVDDSGVIEPGTYQGAVTDPETDAQNGTLAVTLVDAPGAQYFSSNNPVPHIGVSGGRIEIAVTSLNLELPVEGIISGLQIVPLFGSAGGQESPVQVLALDAAGEIIGASEFSSIPDNSQATDDPAPLNSEFAVEESVATFRIVVPQGGFVTFIRIYLVDP